MPDFHADFARESGIPARKDMLINKYILRVLTGKTGAGNEKSVFLRL